MTKEPHPEIRKRYSDERNGNDINGLGESTIRRATPFLWHAPPRTAIPQVREYVTKAVYASFRRSMRPRTLLLAVRAFTQDLLKPKLRDKASAPEEADPATLTGQLRVFLDKQRVGDVGVTGMEDAYLFDGYEPLPYPNLVLMAFPHHYRRLAEVVKEPRGGVAATEVMYQYKRGEVVAARLANFIRARGYSAETFAGSSAKDLNLIPAAIAAGLGELGKHGSLIHKQLGASFRLAAVATDMPLEHDREDVFGADDFCTRCQICTRACPPDAIFDDKQLVRGVKKWYVDFDACIPYFAETAGCGICIAVCPWSRPDVQPKLLAKMTKRRAKAGIQDGDSTPGSNQRRMLATQS